MSLAPKFSGARKVFGGTAAPAASAIGTLHTIEVFLDFACPFSASKIPNYLTHLHLFIPPPKTTQ